MMRESNETRALKVQITIDDTTYEVEVEDSEEGYPSVLEPPPARTTIQSQCRIGGAQGSVCLDECRPC